MRDELAVLGIAVLLCTTVGCSCGSDDSADGTSGGAAGAAGAGASGGSGGTGGSGGSGGTAGESGGGGAGGEAGISGAAGVAGAAGTAGAAGADAGVDAGPASLTLVTFDGTRGGEMAGATGVPFADTRLILEAKFAITWQEVASLTTLATSNADGILISPVFSASSGITPLSTAEQTALLDFAKAGHFVVLLTENDISFDAASDSFLAPFGLTAQGTIQGDTTGTATVTHPITTGWSTVTLGWPGSTPVPDAGAQVIATSPLGPYIVVFESGALGSGSAPVVIITDASPYYSGWTGSNSPESLTILENALHHASGK